VLAAAGGKRVRFDDALRVALDVVTYRHILECPTVVVRDLYGRIHLVVDDREAEAPRAEVLAALASELRSSLGAFAPQGGEIVRLASSMIDPAAVIDTQDAKEAPDLAPLRKPANDHDLAVVVSRNMRRGHEPPDIRVLERTVLADWLGRPLDTPKTPRVTLFGIKGGVGRSTAAAVLAQRFARANKRVLLIDLDLESPGMGSVLLPEGRCPDFGVVDWLVEQAVGQEAGLVAEMAVKSPLGEQSGSVAGEILVVPAGGRTREGYDYLAKLSRSYLDTPAEDAPLDFPERLSKLVVDLESHWKPDVTLLDSRAGLHDIAAVTITRLGATSLLFAVDTPQTWAAYRILFDRWRQHPLRAKGFREGLKMVAAMTPETETTAYLERFTANAYRAFQETLYETADETAMGLDAWNFDLHDPDAPHVPLRVEWSRALMQFDPVRDPGALTPQQVEAAFGSFVAGATSLIFGTTR
jgi:CobQ/CobB/MinD/ParA nucleotide binding domain